MGGKKGGVEKEEGEWRREGVEKGGRELRRGGEGVEKGGGSGEGGVPR